VRPLLFVFLDGVGVGPADPDTNPLTAARTPAIRALLGGRLDEALPERGGVELVYRRLDATLGYPGLPQSATGQATLLSGINGAEMMDRHYGPWPGPTLKRSLDDATLFHDGVALGGALLANAYPPGYFRSLEGGRMRANVPVYAARAAGLALPTLDDYRRGQAISADLTGEHFATHDGGPPGIDPADTGRRLAALALERPFTFFDFWLSDRTGHRALRGESLALVERLDTFLGALFAAVDDDPRLTVLVTSDHGNLEDLGSRRHSRSPVPLIVVGPGARAFAGAASLLDVAPSVRRWWRGDSG
jgi:hypothetical protein